MPACAALRGLDRARVFPTIPAPGRKSKSKSNGNDKNKEGRAFARPGVLSAPCGVSSPVGWGGFTLRSGFLARQWRKSKLPMHARPLLFLSNQDLCTVPRAEIRERAHRAFVLTCECPPQMDTAASTAVIRNLQGVHNSLDTSKTPIKSRVPEFRLDFTQMTHEPN